MALYLLPTLVLFSLVHAASSITVVSYNQYWWNVRQNNRWSALWATIGRHQADLYGFQECEDVSRAVSGAGLQGFRTYQGPNKPSGNPAPLAWKTALFDTISGPNAVQVASDRWGARYLTWVRLRHKSSGKNIFFGNTHGPLGQCGSSTLAANWANAIRNNMQSGDVLIITGDWNCGFGDAALSQVRGIVSQGVKHGIDMILTSVSASGGAQNGSPSDHPLIKANVDVGSGSGGGGGGGGGGSGTSCPSTMACNGNECYTCKSRAEWVHRNRGVTQDEADRRIKAEFPTACASCVSGGGGGGGDTDPSCFDLESHCNHWQGQGFCQGQYADSMKHWCPASCGHCAAGPPLASAPVELELPPVNDDGAGNTGNNTGNDDSMISGSERVVASLLSFVLSVTAIKMQL